MPAGPHRGRCVQGSCGVALGRVDQTDRRMVSGDLDGELQVTVVADHYCGVDGTGKHVDEKVSRDVHVAALLLPSGNGRHESGVGDIAPGVVSDQPEWVISVAYFYFGLGCFFPRNSLLERTLHLPWLCITQATTMAKY